MNERRSRGGARVMPLKRRIILIVLLLILAFLTFKTYKLLSKKKLEYDDKLARIEALNEEIEAENEREKMIESSKSQVITDEDYESLAREELGLIRKDEIVIKPR